MTSFKLIPPSGNPVVDGLIIEYAWADPVLTYGFGTGDMNRNGVPDFEEGDWKAFHRELIANVESFTQLRFQEVSGTGTINFLLFEGGGGWSGVPGPWTTSVETAVGIHPDVPASAAVVRLGTYSVTWFHELGHALGLKHPHEQTSTPVLPGVAGPADWGTGNLNSKLYSVMGYTYEFLGEDNPFTPANDPGATVRAQPGSFGALDIATLQHMYGARAANTGNDTYRFSDDVDANRGYTTIWDTGGTDAIEYVGTGRAKIDLRAAALQAEIGGGGWVSTSQTLTGGFTIAHGVTVENAVGGNQDDILVGNEAANILRGGAGDDRLTSHGGDDRLDGGAGIDTAAYTGAFADHRIVRTSQTEAVVSAPGGGTDRLVDVEWIAFSDRRVELSTLAIGSTGVVDNGGGGGGGEGTGGGSGGGVVPPQPPSGPVTVATNPDGSATMTLTRALTPEQLAGFATPGVDTVNSPVSVTLPTGIENITLTGTDKAAAVGSGGNNRMIGNGADNVFKGGGGHDIIEGGAGFDRVDLAGRSLADYDMAIANGRLVLTQKGAAGGEVLQLGGIEALGLAGGGVIGVAESPVGTLFRLYEGLFDRAPDLAGMNFWLAHLNDGFGLSAIAGAFANSREFQDRYGTLSNTDFVQAMYRDVLERTGEDSGVGHYVERLADGRLHRGDVLLNFVSSPEDVARTGVLDTSFALI